MFHNNNSLDGTWLLLESDDTPMHAAVLAIFRKPQRAADDWLAGLGEAMRAHDKPVQPWNQRLARNLIDVLRPRTTAVAGWDADYHFRRFALPSPGGERELGSMVSMLHSTALDRSRPLWQFCLIEGLERDRFAFYLKVHRAMLTGVNAVPVLTGMLSPSPRRRHMAPFWAVPAEDRPGSPAGGWALGRGLSALGSTAASLGKAAASALETVVRPGARDRFLLPAGAPRSTLNRKINAQRRIATQTFERKRLERVAAATDASVNELLAYMAGSSLRRFFKEYNALPDEPLVGVVPVPLRRGVEGRPGQPLAGIRVPLATNIGDPLARLSAIRAAARKMRGAADPKSGEPVNSLEALLRSAPIYASQVPVVGGLVPPSFNLVVSNWPGPERPLYFNGARMESVFALSPLLQFSALSIHCVEYAGMLDIALTGARDTLPHLQRLAVYLGRALDDLEEVLREREVVS